MTGDLEGCLTIFPKSFKCKSLNGFDKYIERGREVFDGTLDGREGRFKTKYKVVGIYAQGFCEKLNDDDPSNDAEAFNMQLAGGCDHKVIGKSGVFEDADGLITFLDVIPRPLEFSGASNFHYFGYIDLEHHH